MTTLHNPPHTTRTQETVTQLSRVHVVTHPTVTEALHEANTPRANSYLNALWITSNTYILVRRNTREATTVGWLRPKTLRSLAAQGAM